MIIMFMLKINQIMDWWWII